MTQNTSSANLLLVEDDHFIRSMYQKKLSSEGFTVIEAVDGKEALEKASTTPLDLIMLDIMLPKLGGWEVLAELKKDSRTKDIPVLMLTNIGSKPDVERALEMGAVDYLIKAHFIPSEVVSKIRNLLKESTL